MRILRLRSNSKSRLGVFTYTHFRQRQYLTSATIPYVSLEGLEQERPFAY